VIKLVIPTMPDTDRQWIERSIADALTTVDDDVRREWSSIAMEPEEWDCPEYDGKGERFWVVGLSGDRVFWYNHVEEGFNISRFSRRGVIDEYWCNQDDFAQVLHSLPSAEKARVYAAGRSDLTVPIALQRGGQILRRQTTYWVVTTGDTQWRIHFAGKVEFSYSEEAFASVRIENKHPVLDDWNEPWCSIFLACDPVSDGVLEEIDRAVKVTTDGWRFSRTYLNNANRVSGTGLLLRGPLPVVTAVENRLAASGIRHSVLDGHGPRGRFLALILGHNFVVAESFRFEGETPEAKAV